MIALTWREEGKKREKITTTELPFFFFIKHLLLVFTLENKITMVHRVYFDLILVKPSLFKYTKP